jgi:hypothetical protein
MLPLLSRPRDLQDVIDTKTARLIIDMIMTDLKVS